MVAMWRAYPGRLAHLEGDRFREIVEGGRRVGSSWSSLCGRVELRIWRDARPWQANHVTRETFAATTSRLWCLRCAYDALWSLDPVLWELPDWRVFCDRIARDAKLQLVPFWNPEKESHP